MDKKINFLIIGLLVGLIVGGAAGYRVANNIRKAGFGIGNFQIDEETKASILSFFNNASDINEIRSYCGENRNYCFYYCSSINQNHDICSELMNQGGQPWNQ